MTFAQTKSPEYLAEYTGREVVDVAITMGTLEVIFMGLFLVACVRNKTIHGMDVYLMIPAFMFSFGLAIISFGTSYNILARYHFYLIWLLFFLYKDKD